MSAVRLFDRLEWIDDATPRGATLNMALDEALLEGIGKTAVLRVYRWARPAVSFGCFERFAEVQRAFPAHEWVRRWTGGGVVEHGRDWTYSLVIPRGAPLAQMRAGESYRAIHAALGEVLGGELAATDQPKVSPACFENPVRHDLVMAGRKVAGAAQRRTRRGLLHQGSVRADLLGAVDAEKVARAMAEEIVQRELSEGTMSRAAMLATSRYGDRGWVEKL